MRRWPTFAVNVDESSPQVADELSRGMDAALRGDIRV